MKAKRKGIPQKVRFEVFKRDSFKCQYCGRSAPDVVLRADHIEPHSKGGSDDITNLITACQDCNSGKGAIRLTDQTLLDKTKEQLSELQEKRNQLEAMMEWRKGLVASKNDAATMISRHMAELAPGFHANETGIKCLTKWISTFSFEEVLAAVQTAVDAYIKKDDVGKITQESWANAFSKIPGICRMARLDKENPEAREIYYIRGIVRNRHSLDGYKSNIALNLLMNAHAAGVSIESLRSAALDSNSFRGFETKVINLISKEGGSNA